MSCLRAVQQAYRERAKAEKLVSTVDKVTNLRELREASKQQARNFLEEKRIQAIKKKDNDANDTIEALERRVNHEKAERDRRKEIRLKSRELSKSSLKDKSFMVDFTGQHTSISNALIRHDRQAKDDFTLQSRQNHVDGERDYNKHR